MANKIWAKDPLVTNSVNTSQSKVRNMDGSWTITETFDTIVPEERILAYVSSLQDQVSFLETEADATIDDLTTEIETFPGIASTHG